MAVVKLMLLDVNLRWMNRGIKQKYAELKIVANSFIMLFTFLMKAVNFLCLDFLSSPLMKTSEIIRHSGSI